jgi:thiamine monophosphate synthase
VTESASLSAPPVRSSLAGARLDAPVAPQLPRLLVVANADNAPRPLPEIVAAAASYGARGFVLRARELPPRERAELAAALRAVLPEGCLLIQAGGAGPAVHLSATEDFPQPRPSLVGRSCHHAGDVDRALDEKCDYVFVSPVYETASKPGYGPGLGPTGLATLCRRSQPLRSGQGLPVYALGGVLPERVAECRKAGAYGVAVMGPVLRDPPIVAAYLAALSEETPS